MTDDFDPEKLHPRLKALRDKLIATVESPEYQHNAEDLAKAAIEPPEVTRHRRCREMHIPRDYWDKLHEPHDSIALSAVKSLLEGDRRFLLMCGERGRGKTFAACHALLTTGGEYVTAMEMVEAGFNADFWDSLRLARLLVIDEIGREPLDDKGYALGRFYDVVNRRYSDKRKTILIGNVGLDVFKARYCPGGDLDPLYDRIRTAGLIVTPSSLRGPSLRRVSP